MDSISPTPSRRPNRGKQSRLRKWLKVFIALAVVAGVVGGGVVYLKQRVREAAQAELDKRKVKVERRDIRKELTLTGKVLPSSSAAVYSPVSGRLKELFVKEGATVKQGVNLFSVIQDTSGQRELEAAQTDVDRARLELGVAQQNLESRKSVKDLFSDTENRRAEEEANRRRLDYEAARQKLDLLRESLGLQGLPLPTRRQVQKTGTKGDEEALIFVKAPKDGVVTFLAKSVGESVLATAESANATGREILTISDLEKMIVRSRILESDLASVKVGMPVKVKLDAYRAKEYAGTLARISQQGVEDTQAGYTYFVTDVVFERPDDDVRSQMNATISLLVAERKNVLALPAVAVATLGGNSVVELPPGEAKQARYRKVQVGLSTESSVEIADPGVKEGDEFLEIDFSKLDLTALSQGKLGDNDKLTERRL
ncbi:MAG: HlyD family efflux transporter periplasmic adaptor subunit [Silvanigrellales bacterium]|nr:HlyD family efflux transporter periplasmic adaptor subunit [Silvanigrellales bacterium]